MFRERILPILVWLFYKAWSGTWRVRVHESPGFQAALKNQTPFILAVWHGDELALVHFAPLYKLSALTSTSKDGELMNQILILMGFRTARGSSTRGAVGGLKGLYRLAKEGWMPIFAVDGPKGPYHVPKAGVFELSRFLNAPIIPGGVAASRSFVFKKSWNKAFLPLPFSKVGLVWSDPLPPVEKDGDPRDSELHIRLAEAIDAAGQAAFKLIATPK